MDIGDTAFARFMSKAVFFLDIGQRGGHFFLKCRIKCRKYHFIGYNGNALLHTFPAKVIHLLIYFIMRVITFDDKSVEVA
ncbi:hypothetical protein A8L34_20325 [Bacillus sp. FJAT-27264]|nr:hypothetical protein A8L34_20325 [Bacillus sp. FJAT-27264]